MRQIVFFFPLCKLKTKWEMAEQQKGGPFISHARICGEKENPIESPSRSHAEGGFVEGFNNGQRCREMHIKNNYYSN